MPEWYAKWGIAGEDYERLHEKTLVAVSNAEGGHAVFLLDGVYYQQESGFEDLVKSGLYAALPLDVLTGLLHDIFGFLGFGEGAHGTCADGSSR